MAFIVCDDHNLSVEADDVEAADARKLMFAESKPGASKEEAGDHRVRQASSPVQHSNHGGMNRFVSIARQNISNSSMMQKHRVVTRFSRASC